MEINACAITTTHENDINIPLSGKINVGHFGGVTQVSDRLSIVKKLFGTFGEEMRSERASIDGDGSSGGTGENDFKIGGFEFVIGAGELFEPDTGFLSSC